MKPLLLLVILCFGCDAATVRESDDALPNLRPGVVHVRLSPDGMSALYGASNPDGLTLVASPSAFLIGNDTVQIGPLDASLPISDRSFQPANGVAATLTRLGSFRTFVPIRIKTIVETRICKFEVTSTDIDIVAAVGIEMVEGVQVLSVLDTPSITSGEIEAAPFGPCETSIELDTLVSPVENYVLQAIVESTARALDAPVVPALGLLQGSVEIRPPVRTTTRSGDMTISQLPAASGVTLSEDGVSLALDARTVANRAFCVPPISAPDVTPIAADDVTAEALAAHSADLGLAISIQALTSIAEGITLSGLGCYDIDGPLDPISKDEAALGDIGLGNVPVDGLIKPVIIPGSLPSLETNIDTNRIVLRFPSLTVEAHGEVFGVTQKLIGIDATVELTLDIRPVGSGLRFNIEAIDVSQTSSNSKWTPGLPGDTSDWARRFLLVTLANRFSFQLPISPEFPVRALESEIRERDVVLYIAIGE